MVDNYNSYTATELYNYYNELAAKDCLSLLKVKQVLTYYPDQSKAIFEAINEYRRSLGVAELVWSDALSKTSRLEAGYYTYLFRSESGEKSEDMFLRMHHGYQNGCIKIGGRMTNDEIMTSWKNSSGHDALLKDISALYGGVAYYTYNDSNGSLWSKVIFTATSFDKEALTHATAEYYDIILNCSTSSRIYE